MKRYWILIGLCFLGWVGWNESNNPAPPFSQSAWPSSNHSYYTSVSSNEIENVQVGWTAITNSSANWNFTTNNISLATPIQLYIPPSGTVWSTYLVVSNTWVQISRLPLPADTTVTNSVVSNSCVHGSVTSHCVSLDLTVKQFAYSTNATTTTIQTNHASCCTKIVSLTISNLPPCDYARFGTNTIISTQLFLSAVCLTNPPDAILGWTNGLGYGSTPVNASNQENCAVAGVPQLSGWSYLGLTTNSVVSYLSTNVSQNPIPNGSGDYLICTNIDTTDPVNPVTNIDYCYTYSTDVVLMASQSLPYVVNTNRSLNVTDTWHYDLTTAQNEREIVFGVFGPGVTNWGRTPQTSCQIFSPSLHPVATGWVAPNLAESKNWVLHNLLTFPYWPIWEYADTNGTFDAWCNELHTGRVFNVRLGLYWNGKKGYSETNSWGTNVFYRPPSLWAVTQFYAVNNNPTNGFTTDPPDSAPLVVNYAGLDPTCVLCALHKLPVRWFPWVITNSTPLTFLGYTVGSNHDQYVSGLAGISVTNWACDSTYFNYTPAYHFTATQTNSDLGNGNLITNLVLFSGKTLRLDNIPDTNYVQTNAIPIAPQSWILPTEFGHDYYWVEFEFYRQATAITNWSTVSTNKLPFDLSTLSSNCQSVFTNIVSLTFTNTGSNTISLVTLTNLIVTCNYTNATHVKLTIDQHVVWQNYTDTVWDCVWTNLDSIVWQGTNDVSGDSKSVTATNISIVSTNYAVAPGFHDIDYQEDGMKTILNALPGMDSTQPTPNFVQPLSWYSDEAKFTAFPRYDDSNTVSAVVGTNLFGGFYGFHTADDFASIQAFSFITTNDFNSISPSGVFTPSGQILSPPSSVRYMRRGLARAITETNTFITSIGYFRRDIARLKTNTYHNAGLQNYNISIPTNQSFRFITADFMRWTNFPATCAGWSDALAYLRTMDSITNLYLGSQYWVNVGTFYTGALEIELWHNSPLPPDTTDCCIGTNGVLHAVSVHWETKTNDVHVSIKFDLTHPEIAYASGTFTPSVDDCVSYGLYTRQNSVAGLFGDVATEFESARDVYIQGVQPVVDYGRTAIYAFNTNVLPVPMTIFTTTVSSVPIPPNTTGCDPLPGYFGCSNVMFATTVTTYPLPHFTQGFSNLVPTTDISDGPTNVVTNIQWLADIKWAGPSNSWDSARNIPMWHRFHFPPSTNRVIALMNFLTNGLAITPSNDSTNVYGFSFDWQNIHVIQRFDASTNGMPHRQYQP